MDFFLVLIGAFLLPSVHALEFRIDESDRLRDVSRSVLATLPSRFSGSLVEVRIKAGELGEKNAYFDEASNEIVLNQNLLAKGTDKLKSVLIHELEHVYEARVKRLSETRELRNITFWLNSKRNGNQFRETSADPYEYKSPAESAAVNFESFILDSEFPCRKPLLNELFTRELGKPPVQEKVCELKAPVPLKDENGNIRWIDLKKQPVLRAHYFLAARGSAAMSRWGHAMLRLVVNESDPSSDIVVSFVANVEGSINNWKGLFGGYRSIVTFRTMASVTREYNDQELRDLESYPLILKPDQLQNLLMRLSEIYWTYQGNYRFLTNNCADEALRFLKPVLGGDPVFDLGVTTPVELKRKLIRMNLAEDLPSHDRLRNISLGLVFPSAALVLDQALNNLARYLPSLDRKTYFRQAGAMTWSVLEPLQKTISEFDFTRVYLSFKLLEQRRIRYLIERRNLLLMKQMKNESEWNFLLPPQPYQIRQAFYGIPAPADVSLNDTGESEIRSRNQRLDQMMKEHEALISPYRGRIQEIEKNLSILDELVLNQHS